MFLDSTKTEIEQNLEVTQKENHLLNDRLKDMEMQMVKIMELAKQLEIAR
jgi:hypothetical protein